MKKLFLILFLILFASSNILAMNYSQSFLSFNYYLKNNGFDKYVKLDSNGRLQNNLNIKAHKNRWGILYKSNPNRDTLIYYLYKYQHSHLDGNPYTKQWETVEVKPSKKPYEFKFNLIEDKLIQHSKVSSSISVTPSLTLISVTVRL